MRQQADSLDRVADVAPQLDRIPSRGPRARRRKTSPASRAATGGSPAGAASSSRNRSGRGTPGTRRPRPRGETPVEDAPFAVALDDLPEGDRDSAHGSVPATPPSTRTRSARPQKSPESRTPGISADPPVERRRIRDLAERGVHHQVPVVGHERLAVRARTRCGGGPQAAEGALDAGGGERQPPRRGRTASPRGGGRAFPGPRARRTATPRRRPPVPGRAPRRGP